MVKIVVDNNRCNGCETCVNTCPVGIYEMKDRRKEESNLTLRAVLLRKNRGTEEEDGDAHQGGA